MPSLNADVDFEVWCSCGEGLCVWAIVDTEVETEARSIAVVGTGHEMGADNFKYIGTAQMRGGALIWHVFEVIK